MRHILLAAVSLGLVVACGSPSETTPETTPTVANQQTETQRLNMWFEARYKEELDFSPISKTFQGIDEDQDKIDQMSVAAMDAQLTWQRAAVAEMKTFFDYDSLEREAKTSYDLFVYQLEQAEASDAFRNNGYVFNQMNQVHAFFPQLLIAFHKVRNAQDMENYHTRVGESARALRQLIDLAKASAETGVRPPYFSYDEVISGAQAIITGAPFTEGEDSSLWADAKLKLVTLVDNGEMTQEEADAMQARLEAAFTGDFQAAYEEVITYLEADRANVADVAQGVSSLPNGVAYYNERLANQTTTPLTADEIHAIGLAEVTRLRADMETVKVEFGFDGSLQEFFTFLRDTKDDERLYYPNTDEGRQAYIDDATAAIDNITKNLPDYFGIMPKAGLEVKRVESFREQDGAAQHYYSGTPDGSRPGIYYAHLSDMTAMPKRELEVIAYHEGNPGHHMQISIAQELENLPTFRTQAGFTAFSEGWALYSEALAAEIPGTYQTPLSRFGRLGSEMWRAIRLVVDTGLHAKGWTEDEAVAYFLANSAITDAQARSEVRRYLVLPGQATSYKVGMIRIQQLRATAQEALGEAFDIRAFHDTVLSGGALPLDLLERRVNTWVESVKSE